jgi:hypothetical protein
MVGEFDRFRSKFQLLTSRLSASWSQEKHLRNDRFALPHELSPILSPTLDGINLLLGEASYNHVLKVSRTKAHRELGNVLVVAPTRGGKGLLAESQLLTWQGSVIVNDIKGELFNDTAGYRKTLGEVYVIDPEAIGHQYNPLKGKASEDELYASAEYLI